MSWIIIIACESIFSNFLLQCFGLKMLWCFLNVSQAVFKTKFSSLARLSMQAKYRLLPVLHFSENSAHTFTYAANISGALAEECLLQWKEVILKIEN